MTILDLQSRLEARSVWRAAEHNRPADPPPPAPSRPRHRNPVLDAMRGIFILSMTAGHLASGLMSTGGPTRSLVSSLSFLASGPRLRPDPGAVTEVERMGEPSGNLHHPTVTLHTVADPQVPVQNERVFADEVAGHRAGADLLQLYTVPPDVYGDAVRAPYGAGHCLFTDEERLAHVTLLDAWVRTGLAPDRKGVASAVRGPGGFTTDYSPERWPASDNELVPHR